MKRNRKGRRKHRAEVRIWDLDEARRALPYITSVMGSVREHFLEMRSYQICADRLACRPGRPDRGTIIAEQEARREADAARERCREAADELHALHIQCLDPARGEALVPFLHDDQVAWLVYDLFAPTDFVCWRYDNDPPETDRPMAAALPGTAGDGLVA